jgi:hypothetical protein
MDMAEPKFGMSLRLFAEMFKMQLNSLLCVAGHEGHEGVAEL